MSRQFNVLQNGKLLGKFTIVCNKDIHTGGWQARPKYRSQWGGWSLDKTPAYVDKQDAIDTATQYIYEHAEIDKCTIEPVNQTNWSFV